MLLLERSSLLYFSKIDYGKVSPNSSYCFEHSLITFKFKSGILAPFDSSIFKSLDAREFSLEIPTLETAVDLGLSYV